MLYKFRTHHIKRILWALVLLIIPAFVLWGGISFLKTKKEEAIGEIGGHRITSQRFNYYLQMAKVYFSLFIKDKEKLTSQDYITKAWELLLLIWKADREKIKSSDEEVVKNIENIFSTEGKFNKDLYFRFLKYGLRMQPRVFEECIRNFIRIDKLLQRHIKIEISDSEIRELYKKDNQQAKIGYLFIPYERFEKEINIEEEEIKNFYDANKNIFKEEPKVKIKYIAIDEENGLKNEILNALSSIKNLDELKNYFSVEIKESDFIGLKDPLEGIGWYPQINTTAFNLKEKEISSPIKLKNKTIIIEKEGEKASFIPPLNKIKNKVKEKLKEEKLKEKTKKVCQEILTAIKNKNIKDLKKIARDKGVEFKETEYFKYYDYIEGMGVDEKVSKIIFSLRKGEIYSQPIMLLKGGYIVQLKDITAIDEEKFKEEKKSYSEKLYKSRSLVERMKFISNLEKEAQLKIYSAEH
jgi:parvulin-like peptidyl-prolyl isomerase